MDLIRCPRLALATFLLTALGGCALTGEAPRATGDLGVIVERAAGSLLIVDTTADKRIARVEGLGDLSHASVVFSRDERFAYVFGRDGALSKVDLLTAEVVNRVAQASNSVGGAISQDGSLVAASNYEPGGVRVFDADTLAPVAEIPATYDGGRSRVVGLTDAPGQRFVFTLFDAGEIWTADFDVPDAPRIRRYRDVGDRPYDALITPDGRHYLAGLFGEDGVALLDLWRPNAGVRAILPDYGRGEERMPVYKMPHLEGWAMADDYAFLPAVGRNQVLVVDRHGWEVVRRIPVHGQPVFVMARPDGRHVWVNFAFADNDTVQVIDVADLSVVKTLEPGKGVLHMEFAPRGEEVWISVRDEDEVIVYDTADFSIKARLPADKPSGIFFTDRASRIGL